MTPLTNAPTMSIALALVLLASASPAQLIESAGEDGVVKVKHFSRLAGFAEHRLPWNPYWKMLDESSYVLVGKLIEKRGKLDDSGQRYIEYPAAIFEITQVIKQHDAILKRGRTIEFPIRVDGQPGDVFGLYTSTHGGGWLAPERLPAEVLAYINAIPPVGERRFQLLLKQIESKNKAIAFDAFSGFRDADPSELRRHRGRLNPTNVLNRVLAFSLDDSRDEPAPGFSFDGDSARGWQIEVVSRVVGLTGGPREATTLEKHVLLHEGCYRRDALLAAYIALRGSAGLKTIETDIRRKVASGYPAIYDRRDLLAAGELLCVRVENPIPRDHFVKICLIESQRSETRAAAVRALAAWKDWRHLNRVAGWLEREDNWYTQKELLFYMLCCADDPQAPEAAIARTLAARFQKQLASPFRAADATLRSKDKAWRKRVPFDPKPTE